ncbi:uncharacterized protein LOC107647426 [Arachis ipaensis]|uniref:uncharacterized protein LOC107647426 n=1 Tax=Arachis ipaensis TaxID=130454 RepID=UPI0007AEF893|nr:uncharacterized protein LOC107647426 [Arachis ipaensis]XP_025661955.1 uncharacterized protein LOC112757615 [Arachis hypogaea]
MRTDEREKGNHARGGKKKGKERRKRKEKGKPEKGDGVDKGKKKKHSNTQYPIPIPLNLNPLNGNPHLTSLRHRRPCRLLCLAGHSASLTTSPALQLLHLLRRFSLLRFVVAVVAFSPLSASSALSDRLVVSVVCVLCSLEQVSGLCRLRPLLSRTDQLDLEDDRDDDGANNSMKNANQNETNQDITPHLSDKKRFFDFEITLWI